MVEKLYHTEGESIPLIWYFKYDVFQKLGQKPDVKSVNIAGHACMINFRTSGSHFLYQDNKAHSNYKKIENLMKDIEPLFERYIVLTISVADNLPNNFCSIKTTKGKNFELIKNLSKSFFGDINQIDFELSASDAVLVEDRYIEIEISLSETVFLTSTSIENIDETPMQNSIRMLVYTLFGALNCR